MNFVETMWSIITIFVFVAYLMFLFSIVTDLFRDEKLNGWIKALWLLALIVLPVLTALVYVIFRGAGMAQRANQHHRTAEANVEQYIRRVAQTNPAEQIASAKELLDSGALTQAEFDQLKSKVLASA